MASSQTDEELAKRLQEQYRLEFLQVQAQRQARNRASAPPATDSTTQPQFTQTSRQAVEEPVVLVDFGPSPQLAAPPAAAATVKDDEALARRLQNELDHQASVSRSREGRVVQREPFSMALNNNNNTSNDNHNRNSDARLAQRLQDEELLRRYGGEVQATSSGNTAFIDERASDDSDMAQARRVAQELQDAEMAQRLTLYEQEANSRRLAQQRLAQQRFRPWKYFLLFFCVVLLTVPILMWQGVFKPEDIPIFGDFDPNDWVDTDPWSEENNGGVIQPGESPDADGAIRWASNGRGLDLEILNALEEKWYAVFNEAVANWDVGAPIDSLTLTTKKVDYDMVCTPVPQTLKVCNGNYGNTRWRGLNEVLLNRRTNVIVSSTAKMNEYYLADESYDQWLYTMCHEMGHGFGLPHWDEDFLNADMGNCMDYTQNPGANKLPDESNFQYLAELYGGMNVTSNTVVQLEDSGGGGGGGGGKKKGGNRRRQLRNSKVILEEGEQGTRMLLHANERSEIHWKPIDDETGIVYHYHLVE